MPSRNQAAGPGGEPFAFTEARIAAACRGARREDADDRGRITWRDTSCTGLTLRLNVNTGHAGYYFVAKVGGKVVRRALGDVQVVRLEEAREVVNRLRYDRTVSAMLNPRPAAEGDEAPPSPRVGDVLDELLEAHTAGRWLPGNRTRIPTDRTMKFYRDLRAARFKDYEDLTLDRLADELPAIYGKMQAEAAIQANRFLQLVRNLYAFASSAGLWTAPNPAIGDGTKRLTRTPEKPRERVLTDAEWRRLDKSMSAENRLWRDLFTMSVLTLQRMGAVRHMRWADLAMTGSEATWKIPAQWMKGRKAGHVVPLADLPGALAILRDRRKIVPKSCQWVFPAAEGDDGPARNYDKAWKRILERAKLWSEDKEQCPRPHDLRRTGGARMTEAGVPLQTVTRALGNAPSSAGMVARVYAQVPDEALRDAFKATAKRGRGRR